MRAQRALVNLLYPPACVLCELSLPLTPGVPPPSSGNRQRPICEACLNAMPRSEAPVCLRCGVDLSGAFDAKVLCALCRRRPLAFDMARAPWRYGGTAQEAIRHFKYDHRWRLGAWLADAMAATARASLPLDRVDLVIPVPLHWLKRRLRGFNPAERLASHVAHACEKPCAPRALRRQRWTRTQTRLGWGARFHNVRAAFTAQPSCVRQRSVLLVDDVLTSGATVHACATALRAAGARAVFVLTAARTPRKP